MKSKLAAKRIIPERQGSLSQCLAKVVKHIPNKDSAHLDQPIISYMPLATNLSAQRNPKRISHTRDYSNVTKDMNLDEILHEKGDQTTLGEVKMIFNDCCFNVSFNSHWY